MISKMSRGYTLVELLVVAVLVILLMGGALVALTKFSEKRGTSEDARLVADYLKSVRVKATAVEVPSSCVNGVASFTVSFSGKAISAIANCQGGESEELPEANMEDGVFVGSLSDLVFSAGSGTVGTTQTISICGFGEYGYEIEVAANGIVSEPVVKDTVCP